eukprot:126166-Chlamydomonas_euryale.AAC.3
MHSERATLVERAALRCCPCIWKGSHLLEGPHFGAVHALDHTVWMHAVWTASSVMEPTHKSRSGTWLAPYTRE